MDFEIKYNDLLKDYKYLKHLNYEYYVVLNSIANKLIDVKIFEDIFICHYNEHNPLLKALNIEIDPSISKKLKEKQQNLMEK